MPRSKNGQKTEDNARLDSNNAVFWAEMDDSPTQVGRPWPELHPPKFEFECLLAQRPPSGAPPAYGNKVHPPIKQEDVIINSPAPVVVNEVYTVYNE